MSSEKQEEKTLSVQPANAVAGVKPYKIPPRRQVVDLPLGNTERLFFTDAESKDLQALLSDQTIDDVIGYPNPTVLEAMIAEQYGVDTDQVIVTAGGDESLERACKSVLMPGTEIIVPYPTFEMIPIYAGLCGAKVVDVPWVDGAYPVESVLGAITKNTRAIVMISPNNPTGTSLTAEQVDQLAPGAKDVLVIAALAYAEFAKEDLMPTLLKHSNVVITRTFSKALGLAGLRVGYAIGDARVIAWLKGASGPYTVSKLSLAMAKARMQAEQAPVQAYIERVQAERDKLVALLQELGATSIPSQANFVLARFEKSAWVKDALEGLGIGVRVFPGKPGLEGAVRITCPGNDEVFERLCDGFRAALNPEAMIFDLDGVLADVSGSYRATIVETAAAFGVTVTSEQISAQKAAGNANNDWVVTQRLCEEAGVNIDFEAIKDKFEEIYQGTAEAPGLRSTETLLTPKVWLNALKAKLPLAIVTGRPRSDALCFFEENDILDCFEVLVCMEDAALKPDPAPVNLALQKLGVKYAWMIGDTPDDIRASRGARVVPLGVLAPGDGEDTKETLLDAGASRVLNETLSLEELLNG
ncbi:MAG: TIGR01548 family HAD-type hydrolase [Deltaproteobacteria bacterium]|nr:TIGR01548 family HAD-type hydrolase [Deltaproteobacteria bacterium]